MIRPNRFLSYLKIHQLTQGIKNWSIWRHLHNFGSFLGDRLQCSVWVFIPVVFIIFSSILLCIRFASKPGVFIGRQFIQVKGQLICCVDPFVSNENIRNYSHRHINTTIVKSPTHFGNIYTSHCLIMAYHRIELYDFDWLTTDDFLNETHTDENGVFELSGQLDEIFPMLPYIVILHQCIESGSKVDENGNFFDYRKSYYSVAPYHVNQSPQSMFPLNLQTLGWRDIHTRDT